MIIKKILKNFINKNNTIDIEQISAKTLREQIDMAALDAVKLFDYEWYKNTYVETGSTELFEHYLNIGVHRGYNPSPFFNTNYYFSQTPELLKNGLNPLLDYVLNFSKTFKNPHLHFNTRFYLLTHKDVLAAGINPLLHYIKHGFPENRICKEPEKNTEAKTLHDQINLVGFNALKFFDYKWYKSTYTEVNGMDLLEHYLNIGVHKGYNPHPLFDTNYYFSQAPELLENGLNPLLDFILNFSTTLKNPNPLFNTSFYLQEYPDVARAGLNPLLHYINNGFSEGRVGKPLEPITTTKNLRDQINSVGFAAYKNKVEIILPINNVINFINSNSVENEILYLNDTNNVVGLTNEVHYPKSNYIAKLKNVLMLAGSRYVIANNNEILHDEEFYFRNSSDADVKYKNAQRIENSQLKLVLKIRQAAWIESGINLMHEYNNNYFHFVVETLPRMLLCEELFIPSHIPFIFEHNLHPNIINLISLINTLKRPIIYLAPDTIYSIKEMYFVSDMSSIIDSYLNGKEKTQSVLSNKYISKVNNRCVEQFPELKNKLPFRKIYVKRVGDYRNLLNQDKIEESLSQLGFEIIDTSILSIEAQIKIFNEASIVVTPTGAQVTNIVWCQNNVNVIILFSDHPSHQHYLWEILGKINNLQVHIHIGLSASDNNTLYGVHNDYTIDITKLISLCNNLV